MTKLNIMEVASNSNMSKDDTQVILQRILKYLSEKLYLGQSVNIDIPSIGQLISRNSLVAVKFN